MSIAFAPKSLNFDNSKYFTNDFVSNPVNNFTNSISCNEKKQVEFTQC